MQPGRGEYKIFRISILSYPPLSWRDIAYNVPRLPEVGDQREPIWAERSGAGYSLLSEEMFCRTGATF